MAGHYYWGGVNRETHRKCAQILKDAIVANAGVYIKLGQLLATLDVIIPDEYREAMVSLCEYNQESCWQEVNKVLSEELGVEWE